MAVISSNVLPLGTKAPDFTLPDVASGKLIHLKEIKSNKATVIAFICNHCPFVKHILPTFVQVAREYQAKGVCFIAISANDPSEYEIDAPEHMKKIASELNFSFPYLYDETQEVAKNFDAVCTPDLYVFDGSLNLVYHGQFDNSRRGNEIAVTGDSLCQTLDNLLTGKPIDHQQKPSIGCSIKWREPITNDSSQ